MGQRVSKEDIECESDQIWPSVVASATSTLTSIARTILVLKNLVKASQVGTAITVTRNTLHLISASEFLLSIGGLIVNSYQEEHIKQIQIFNDYLKQKIYHEKVKIDEDRLTFLINEDKRQISVLNSNIQNQLLPLLNQIKAGDESKREPLMLAIHFIQETLVTLFNYKQTQIQELEKKIQEAEDLIKISKKSMAAGMIISTLSALAVFSIWSCPLSLSWIIMGIFSTGSLILTAGYTGKTVFTLYKSIEELSKLKEILIQLKQKQQQIQQDISTIRNCLSNLDISKQAQLNELEQLIISQNLQIQQQIQDMLGPQFTQIEVFNTVCPICQENFQDLERIKKFPCNHLIHNECMNPQIESCCCICRRNVEKNQNLEDLFFKNQ